MRPFRTGPVGRQLFAVWHPAAQAPVSRPAVLLCNPFGQESLLAYRMLRVLAERLSRAGFPTLRFDYYGTGDSDGESDEFCVASAVEDVAVAQRTLLELSGATKFAWVGLRLGANVILEAAQRLQSAPPLVLWDPVSDGRGYLAQLEASHIAFMEYNLGLRWQDLVSDTQRSPRVKGESTGFSLPARLLQELETLQLGSGTQSARAPVEVLADTADVAALLSGAHWIQVPPREHWNSDRNIASGTVPNEFLRAVQQALEKTE